MKTNIVKYIFFIVIICMVVTGIYILYKESKNQNIGVKDNELQINMIKELNIGITGYDTTNPILSYNRDIQYVDKLIFDPLVDITYNFETENILAKEVSKINNLTYLIKLNEEVYWHDGTKFTAEDVEFTIKNLQKNNIKSIYKENVEKIKELQVIDEYTIKIALIEEVPFFEYMLCFPIIASHAYNENTLISKTTIPTGTGDYKIVNISENNIEIQKVNYDNNTKISTINVVLKKSIKDLYNSLAKNEIDLMVTDNIQYEEYLGTMGYNVSYCANREFEYMVFNNRSKLLSNKEVRKAISHAIDRNRINYNVYNNKYTVCSFPIEYGSYLFRMDDIFEYDVNKSKSILLEDGWIYINDRWKKGSNVIEFDLIVNRDNKNRTMIAHEIKKQLQEIGIITNIIEVNEITYNNYIKNKNYDIILTGNIISNNPNLETFLGENNISNFNNERAKILLDEIKNIDNKETLIEKYIEIEQIYKEQIPFMSLYFNNLFILTAPTLKGDLSHNWYDLFYNLDNWYKIKND